MRERRIATPAERTGVTLWCKDDSYLEEIVWEIPIGRFQDYPLLERCGFHTLIIDTAVLLAG